MLPRATVGKVLKILVPVILMLVLAIPATGAGQKPVTLSAKDKCPVCGMFVAKYPDFSAQIIFRDGTYAVFDGVKDMLKYYSEIPRYAPGKKKADITAIYVTNYYDVCPAYRCPNRLFVDSSFHKVDLGPCADTDAKAAQLLVSI